MSQPPWSYSHLDKFETCPKQFYHVRVAKDYVEPPTEHTLWGHTVHEAFENFIINGTPLPQGMQQWSKLADNIAAIPGDKFPEIKLAVSRSFKPAAWETAWSRGKPDLLILNNQQATILDFKTGKQKPSEQLALYAGYTFAHYDVNEVHTGFVWLKDRKLTKATYTKDDVSSLWRSFVERSARLSAAYELSQWPARPSGLCNGWCPVKSCQFYKDKK